MGQTPPSIERSANAAELLQIEQARRKLRCSAGWTSALGIYLPALVALVTIGWTLANYPGNWAEKLLVSAIELVIVLCVFTLPVMSLSSGRTLLAYRRLRRDGDQGYPIAVARGEVTWGSRDRAIVATVDGERLLSPFFTRVWVLPSYWHHFDLLTPGAYSFSLLPGSRLVLSAQPIAQDVTENESTGPERALRAAFRTDAADAAANRGGRASAGQRFRLLMRHWWAFLFTALFTALSYGVFRPGAPLVAILIPLGITMFWLVVVFRVVWDALEGRVDSAVGMVTVRVRKHSATGWVGATKFWLPYAQARAFQKGHLYRVYWFKHSRAIAGVDPVDTIRQS